MADTRSDALLEPEKFEKKIIRIINKIRVIKRKKVILQRILDELNKGPSGMEVFQLKPLLDSMTNKGILYTKGTGRQTSYFVTSKKSSRSLDIPTIVDVVEIPELSMSTESKKDTETIEGLESFLDQAYNKAVVQLCSKFGG